MSEEMIQKLKSMQPEKEFFIGIDSDGCVFDTMEFKQKKCFHPNIVKHWQLEKIEPYVNETAQFVNLYSKWRGVNRFPAIAMVFDLLRERPEVIESGVTVPELVALKRWMEEETKLGNATLEVKVKDTSDPELTKVHEWSINVNNTVTELVKGIGPFDFVRESLEKAKPVADMIVVSQTPVEALVREWEEHELDGYVRMIAGQEYGTKTEHIQFAADGKYEPDKMLMIGDAPGDRKAAVANHSLFYPILPGRENEAWERFYKEALDRFFAQTYAGDYQDKLIDEFESCLPETPPWKK